MRVQEAKTAALAKFFQAFQDDVRVPENDWPGSDPVASFAAAVDEATQRILQEQARGNGSFTPESLVLLQSKGAQSC